MTDYSTALPGARPYGKASGPRAGFWRRFAAALLDGLIVGVPAFVVFIVTSVAGAGATSTTGEEILGGIVILELLLFAFVAFLYQALLDGGPSGQTLGKRALGIRVIDASTGRGIGYARGFGRAAGKLLFNLLTSLCFVGLVDYVWMLWDRESQTLHDKMVNSYVVPVAAYPAEPR